MTGDVVIASSQADAAAAEAVEKHHAELSAGLSWRRDALSAAAAAHRLPDADTARLNLLEWTRTELVPHALAEESTLYAEAAKRPESRLLVEAMLAEHQVITGLVDDLAATTDAVTAAEVGRALEVVFKSHLAKENEQLLPLLVAAPDVSVTDLLAGMHELLGPDDAHREHAVHECHCGEADDASDVHLDARAIPHSIRHSTIFQVLDTLGPTQRLVLTVSHDPLRLLDQLQDRDPFTVEYLQRGPEVWLLAFARPASVEA